MHWLSTNYQWLVAVVLMPIILLLLKRWVDSRKATATAPPQADESARAATGRDDGPQESEKEETAKVNFIQPRYVLLREEGYAIWHEPASNLESAKPAVVAEFKNNPKPFGQRTVEAKSVRASLVYRGRGNPEELHVSYGTWLDEYTHFASFPSGKTHSLIIAVKSFNPFVALENRRSKRPPQAFYFGSNNSSCAGSHFTGY